MSELIKKEVALRAILISSSLEEAYESVKSIEGMELDSEGNEHE